MKSANLPARSVPRLLINCAMTTECRVERDEGMLQTKFAQNAGLYGIEDRSTWSDQPDNKSLHLQQAGTIVLPGGAGSSV